jgi:hypothetical protein
MLELQAIGCHNINWVTPEHVVPQILEALPLAVEGGLRLPIVYNTSSYDSHDSLRLLDGVVDVYMPDFKLWTCEAARRYLKRPDYADVARESVKEMHRQVGDLVLDERGLARRGLILRHLVMPGLLDETEAILRFVAEELGTGCYVNLMGQYHVSGKVGRGGEYTEIARGIHREEYDRALEVAEELGPPRGELREPDQPGSQRNCAWRVRRSGGRTTTPESGISHTRRSWPMTNHPRRTRRRSDRLPTRTRGRGRASATFSITCPRTSSTSPSRSLSAATTAGQSMHTSSASIA